MEWPVRVLQRLPRVRGEDRGARGLHVIGRTPTCSVNIHRRGRVSPDGQTWTIADVKFYVFFAVELFSDQDEVQAAPVGCPRILASIAGMRERARQAYLAAP